MALSQNKLETYVSPGTSVFVWPCCPLVMWCVQLLLPAQVWPTGLRWAYLSRFAQPIKTLKAFFLLKNEKYFLLILDLNQVIYFIGMQRQSLWGRSPEASASEEHWLGDFQSVSQSSKVASLTADVGKSSLFSLAWSQWKLYFSLAS